MYLQFVEENLKLWNQWTGEGFDFAVAEFVAELSMVKTYRLCSHLYYYLDVVGVVANCWNEL